jgi:hypothetical protein
MVTWFKNFKIGMVAFGAMVFMILAGLQFTYGLVAGEWVCCQSFSTGCPTFDGSMYFPWDYPYWGGPTCP